MYNILLVEDDKNIREMLVEYFSKRDKEKFNITLAENGLKGLDKAYENSYDLMGDVNEWLNLPEDEEYSTEVTGTFKVNYYANGVPSKDISSTKDTATKDTVTKSATGGNGAVQTGNPMTAVSVALVMLVASGAMFVCYRRKIEK